MANRLFTQFFGSLEKKPVLLTCSFKIDPTNTNGLGISSLKGPGISNVFMNTSATPATGNPNPASGIIVVQLMDNYNLYLGGHTQFSNPLSGSTINISTGSSLTVGAAYSIRALGTTTKAQWVAIGLPVGITPAVGVAFIASATSGSGTGTVQAAATAGSLSVQVVGDPNGAITSSAATVMGVTSGAYVIYECLNSSGTLTAPTGLSYAHMSFLLSNSSITVKGQ